MLTKPAREVKFIQQHLEEYFVSLPENHPIKKGIQKAIDKLKENAFCGEKIEKRLIPKEYIRRYDIDNLWWYPLPDGWRYAEEICYSMK